MKPRQPSRVTAGNGGNSIRLQDDGLGDAVQGIVSANLRRSTQAEGSRSHAGRCPEVQGVLDHLSARRALRVRALLRPARGRLRAARRPTPDELQAPHPGGPAHALALRGLPAARGRRRASRAARRAGRRSCAPTASPSGSGCASCGSRTRPRTRRTRSRTASSRSRSPARSELGFETRGLRVHRQPRQRRRRPRGRRRAARLRLHPGRPRGGEDPRHRRLRRAASSRSAATTTTSTASAPSCRASAPAGRSSTSTCGPYYAEGSKTLAFETAEQLGWELPDRVVAPIASGLAVHEGRARLRGVHRRRAARRRACRS